MLVCIIGINTPHETVTLVKRGCWTPFADWQRWVTNKRVTIKLDWGTAEAKQKEKADNDSQSNI